MPRGGFLCKLLPKCLDSPSCAVVYCRYNRVTIPTIALLHRPPRIATTRLPGGQMAPESQVHCLGRSSLHCRGASEVAARQLLLPATLKAQSLLAYLILLWSRPHSRDHLAEIFWGDRPKHKSRHSVATALRQIRRCRPGEGFLLTDAADIRFNPKVHTEGLTQLTKTSPNGGTEAPCTSRPSSWPCTPMPEARSAAFDTFLTTMRYAVR